MFVVVVVSCLLFAVCCLYVVVGYSYFFLFVVWRALYNVCCLLFVASFFLHVDGCLSCVVGCLLLVAKLLFVVDVCWSVRCSTCAVCCSL